MTNYRLERARDPDALARQAADWLAAQISLVLDQRDRCSLALSGGSTPARAYSLLGQEHLPWDRVMWSWVMSAGLQPMTHPAMPGCCARP